MPDKVLTDDEQDAHDAETVVVTRHKALVEYLLQEGIICEGCEVIEHATIQDVLNKHVIGVLPLSLAVHACDVTEVPLNVPLELRGQELNLEQVRLYAQPAQCYGVYRSKRYLE